MGDCRIVLCFDFVIWKLDFVRVFYIYGNYIIFLVGFLVGGEKFGLDVLWWFKVVFGFFIWIVGYFWYLESLYIIVRKCVKILVLLFYSEEFEE